ncbi:MAG: alpha/beta hydrolase, partial [Rikenellaceae bacterium]
MSFIKGNYYCMDISQQITLDTGQRLNFRCSGEGSPLLLLHGWGCTLSIFDSLVPLLSSKFRVYAIDFPGFGDSPEPQAIWGVEQYTCCIEEFCRKLSIENPVLVGHSFGCRVSLLFASRNQVDQMILMGAAGVKPRRSLSYYLKVYSYKCIKGVTLGVMGREKGYRFLRERLGFGGSADYNSSSDVMRGVLSRVVNEDLRAVMPSIKSSTLLIFGSNDTATPVRDGRVMESLISD